MKRFLSKNTLYRPLGLVHFSRCETLGSESIARFLLHFCKGKLSDTFCALKKIWGNSCKIFVRNLEILNENCKNKAILARFLKDVCKNNSLSYKILQGIL